MARYVLIIFLFLPASVFAYTNTCHYHNISQSITDCDGLGGCWAALQADLSVQGYACSEQTATEIINSTSFAIGYVYGVSECPDPQYAVAQTFGLDSCDCDPINNPYDSQTATCSNQPPDCSVAPDYVSKTGSAVPIDDPICVGSCEYDLGNFNIVTEGNSVSWVAEFIGTESNCSPDTNFDDAPDPPCTSGNLVGCILESDEPPAPPSNCGYFNGQKICVPSLPDGNCNLLSGGSFICSDGASPPTNQDGLPPEKLGDVQMGTESGQSNDLDFYGPLPPSSDGTPGTGSGEGDGPGGTGTGTGETGDGTGEGFYKSGDCSAPPSCGGDPILCGIAKEIWKSRCPDLESGLTDLQNAELQPITPVETDLSEMLDQTNSLTGSCPADITFDVMGFSFSLPFTILCDLATYISFFVVAAGLILSLRIIAF